MREATAQERLQALRLVREEQARRASPAEEAEARRRRRLTARLHDVFRIHTTTSRRGRSPPADSVGSLGTTDGGEMATGALPLPRTPTEGESSVGGVVAASSVETIPEAEPEAEAAAAAGASSGESPVPEGAVAAAADDAAPADNPAPERFAAGR
jgi:hypothetical protein